MPGKGEHKLSPRRVAAAQKQAQAVQLRAAGLTLDQIAEAVGYNSRPAVHQAIKAALKKRIADSVDELRAVENERLDLAMRSIVGKVQQGDLDAVREWRALIETRARLNGLNKQVDMPLGAVNMLQIEYVDRLGTSEPVPDWIEGKATERAPAERPAELEATA